MSYVISDYNILYLLILNIKQLYKTTIPSDVNSSEFTTWKNDFIIKIKNLLCKMKNFSSLDIHIDIDENHIYSIEEQEKIEALIDSIYTYAYIEDYNEAFDELAKYRLLIDVVIDFLYSWNDD